ncbi:uncharacterized protein LOC114338755 isoform X2 [Diabrotica virgifera virgifera]|uniref:Uncharacterized protein LOC114338755 isoform X2 n=1 Tax=Diabrotica virgifera virgifera TaxID=50390 RepID=A0A6P7G8P0_DIAVI|nr:uncharacterized protein LOC114338755 isoform X2 [Diabrotica virgifera virgifera]
MPSQTERPMEGKEVMKEVKTTDQPLTIKSSTLSSSSTVSSYMNYRKQVDNNLTEITTNISQMIIDTFKGIDSICSKVRECVSDFNSSRSKILLKANIEIEKNNDQNDHYTEDDEEEINESVLESIHEELEISTKEPNESTNSEPATPSDSGSAYVIESLAFITSNETVKEQEPDILKTNNSPKEEPKTCLPTFITVVGDGNVKTDKTSNPIPQSPNSKVRRKSRKNKRKTLMDNLKEALQLDVDNTDLNSLQTLIENVTQEIDMLCNQSADKSKKVENGIEKNASKNQEEDATSPTEAKAKTPLQIPEVYHRPGVTNIHKRLLNQLEANDSFAAFQKLMRRTKDRKDSSCRCPVSRINLPILSTTSSLSSHKTRCSTKILSRSSIKSIGKRIKEDESNKRKHKVRYTDSLWFNEKKTHKGERGQKKSGHHTKDRYKLGAPMARLSSRNKPTRKSATNVLQKAPKSQTACGCSVTVSNERPVINHNRMHLHIPRGNNRHRKLTHVDILDDLTNRDLLPLRAEYPRRDHLYVSDVDTFKDVHDSYLYKIMYGTKDKSVIHSVWNQLLHPTTDCDEWNKNKSRHDKDHEKLAKKMKVSNEQCRPKSNEQCRPKSNEQCRPKSNDKSTSVKSRRKKAIQALAPYLFDPQLDRRKMAQPLIVMQVHVFYDKDQTITMEYPGNINNYNSKLTPVRRPSPTVTLPLTPMKEIQVSRGKWTSAGGKRQPGKPKSPPSFYIQPIFNKTVATRHSARTTRKEKIEWSRKYDSLQKNENDTNDSKALFPSPNMNSKCNQHMDNKFMRNPLDANKMTKSPSQTKNFIYSIYRNNSQNNIQYQLKMGNTSERNISQLLTPSPKQPNNLEGREPTFGTHFNITTKMKRLNAKKNIKVSRSPTEKPNSPNGPSPVTRHKNMLVNLKGLKQKNDQIQNNIQKAIDVVESKMVDMFSNSGVFRNANALDDMQKEISSVLNSMKFTDGRSSKYRRVVQLSPVREQSPESQGSKRVFFDPPEREKPPGDSIEEQPLEILKTKPDSDRSKHENFVNEFNAISSDVFKKLEKILESNTLNETSRCDMDINRKRKNSSKRRADSLQSASDNTLSSDDNYHRHPKKYRPKENIKINMSKTVSSPVKIPSKERNTPGVLKRTDKNQIPVCYFNLSSSPHLLEKRKESCTHLASSSHLLKSKSSCLNIKRFESKSQLSEISVSETRVNEQQSQDSLEEKLSTVAKDKEPEEDEEHRINTNQNKPAETIVLADKLSDVKENLVAEEKNKAKEEATEENIVEQAKKNDVYDYLEDQVNKIICRVEDIYSQLDEMQSPPEETTPTAIPVFRDESPRAKAIPSEDYLTPFMQAVKNSRSKTKTTEPLPSPTLERRPSYYNVLTFLNTLSDIQIDKAIEVHKAILVNYAYSVSIATTVHIVNITYYASLSYSTVNTHCKEVLEKPGCLKKSKKEMSKVKPKKVSFLVMNQTSSFPVTKINIVNNKTEEVPQETQLNQGDHITNSENTKPVVVCEKLQTSDTSTELSTVTDSITEEELQVTQLSPTGTKSTQIQDLEKSSSSDAMVTATDKISEDSSDLSFMSVEAMPAIKVFYNEPYDIPTVFSNNGHLENCTKVCTRTSAQNETIQKIVIFREVGDVGKLLNSTNLEKLTKKSFMPSNQIVLKREVSNDGNTVLLKSFYAIVYLLVFTALNMEYKCH